MELWIRSQDKNALRKINTGLYLKEGLSNYAEGDAIFIVSGGDELGEYKTKERALKVLDEIQDKLKVLVTNEAGAEFILARNLVPIIYEMPKD